MLIAVFENAKICPNVTYLLNKTPATVLLRINPCVVVWALTQMMDKYNTVTGDDNGKEDGGNYFH